jgi:hypothetical protein
MRPHVARSRRLFSGSARTLAIADTRVARTMSVPTRFANRSLSGDELIADDLPDAEFHDRPSERSISVFATRI